MAIKATKRSGNGEGEIYEIEGALESGREVRGQLFVPFEGGDGFFWVDEKGEPLDEGDEPVEPGDTDAGWDEIVSAI